MERLCKLAFILLLAYSLTMILHATFGGIPADATPGDIFRSLMW